MCRSGDGLFFFRAPVVFTEFPMIEADADNSPPQTLPILNYVRWATSGESVKPPQQFAILEENEAHIYLVEVERIPGWNKPRPRVIEISKNCIAAVINAGS